MQYVLLVVEKLIALPFCTIFKLADLCEKFLKQKELLTEFDEKLMGCIGGTCNGVSRQDEYEVDF